MKDGGLPHGDLTVICQSSISSTELSFPSFLARPAFYFQVFIKLKGAQGKLPKTRLTKKAGSVKSGKKVAFRFAKGSTHVFKIWGPNIGDLKSMVIEVIRNFLKLINVPLVLQAEATDMVHSWGTLRTLAQDRLRWREFVAALVVYDKNAVNKLFFAKFYMKR